MTTYVYETIPQKEGEKPEYFEVKQGMQEPPLTKHPESGKPVRRVILGGYGVLKSSAAGGKESGQGQCGCGPEGCCN